MTTAPLITAAQAAARAHVHRATITRAAAAGQLKPSFKINGKRGAYLFAAADVDAYISARRIVRES